VRLDITPSNPSSSIAPGKVDPTSRDPAADKFRLSNLFERRELKEIDDLGGIAHICEALGTSLNYGIDESFLSVEDRQARFGENVLPAGKKVTFFGLLLDALSDKLLLLLIFAATLQIILGMTVPGSSGCRDLTTTPTPRGYAYTHHVAGETEPPDLLHGWLEGTAILITVTIVVLVSSISDYRKAKKFEELDSKIEETRVFVRRGGEKVDIDSKKLVVGDIILVGGGVVLQADCLFLQGQDVACDESAITGESDLKKKSYVKDPYLISGTPIVTGDVLAVVVAVGVMSSNGKLYMRIRHKGLEKKLEQEHQEQLQDQISHQSDEPQQKKKRMRRKKAVVQLHGLRVFLVAMMMMETKRMI